MGIVQFLWAEGVRCRMWDVGGAVGGVVGCVVGGVVGVI